MDNRLSTFQFREYKVEYVNYVANPDFNFDESDTLDVKLRVEVNVGKTEDNKRGKVTVKAFIYEDAVKEGYPFSLSVSISGFFETLSDISEEQLMNFLRINGTAALFPFLRSTVADITRIANVDPLLLPLMNIQRMVEEEHSREISTTENIEIAK